MAGASAGIAGGYDPSNTPLRRDSNGNIISPSPPGPTSQFGNPATFTAAANTQASDYDTIMKNYADIIAKSSSNPITALSISPQQVSPSGNLSAQQVTGQNNTIAPQTITGSYNTTPSLTSYNQSKDVTKSLSDLSNLVDTGGYSEADKQDIRARDISPTRSIYANAQQNIERQRALQGGYSPNFDATQAAMARDESSQISDINVNANAGIAQNVAANKLSAASPYAAASSSANAAQTQTDQKNADIINQINSENAARNLQVNETNAAAINAANEAGMTRTADINRFNADVVNSTNQANANRNTTINTDNANRNLTADTTNASNILTAGNINRGAATGAISGQANLYGTTPALTSTFGNQVTQAAQLGQGQQNINQNKQNSVFGMAGYRS